jgi:hypothetical protein
MEDEFSRIKDIFPQARLASILMLVSHDCVKLFSYHGVPLGYIVGPGL